MLEKIKKFGWGYILLGVLLVAVGICFISFNNALNVLSVAIGIILLIFGILFGVITLVDPRRGITFALRIILAVICIICGTVCAIVQGAAVSVIADIFCLLLIVDGAFKLQTSINSKRYRIFGWWVMLGLAVAVIISAFLLAKLAPEDTATLTVIAGIIIVTDGISNFLSAFYCAGCDERVNFGVDETDSLPDTRKD